MLFWERIIFLPDSQKWESENTWVLSTTWTITCWAYQLFKTGRVRSVSTKGWSLGPWGEWMEWSLSAQPRTRLSLTCTPCPGTSWWPAPPPPPPARCGPPASSRRSCHSSSGWWSWCPWQHRTHERMMQMLMGGMRGHHTKNASPYTPSATFPLSPGPFSLLTW